MKLFSKRASIAASSVVKAKRYCGAVLRAIEITGVNRLVRLHSSAWHSY